MRPFQVFDQLRKRYQKKLVDFAASFISSASYGLAVYIITLIFAFLYPPAAVGQFRYVLSIMTILMAFTVVEANKLALKQHYKDQSNFFGFAALVRFATGMVIMPSTLIAFWAFGSSEASLATKPLAYSVAALPFFATFDLYNFFNFARKSYIANAAINFVKYTILCIVMYLLCQWAFPNPNAAGDVIPYYFWMLSLFNLTLFAFLLRGFGPAVWWDKRFLMDSARLSAGGIPQTMVENMDKVLVGWVYGPTALGIYALNVSTGRLINTIVKPGLVVLYPYLTHNKVGLRTYLILLAASGAVLGAICPVVYMLFVRFMQPIYVDYIGLIFISLVAFPFSLVYQIKLNEVLFGRDSIRLASRATTIVGVSGMVVMLAAMTLPERTGLYVCAAALPFRYIVGTLMLLASDTPKAEA